MTLFSDHARANRPCPAETSPYRRSDRNGAKALSRAWRFVHGHARVVSRLAFRAWAPAACGFIALGLAACGGGSDAPPVLAGADTLTVAAGQSANLLANDSIGGSPATTGVAGNVTFAVDSGTLPIGVTATDGVVAVASEAVPGDTTLSYTICDTTLPHNCASASARITVPAPRIAAADDALTLSVGTTGDVLANDLLGSSPATAATVTVTATGVPVGLTVSASGLVTVDAAAAAGTTAIGYRICQIAAPTNCATASAVVTIPAVGTLSGRAVSASTGDGIANATVTVAGASAATDSAGNFTLTQAPAGERVLVAFAAPGYAPTTRVASVDAGGAVDVQARLVPIALRAVLDAATGGSVALAGSTAQVTVPANALRHADGSVATGGTTVLVTPIDPSSDAMVLPGDFTALASGLAELLESFGAMDVRFLDASGAPLDLVAGQTATLRVPVASRAAFSPASVPWFLFDEALGRWVRQGLAALGGGNANPYYEAVVTRAGTWGAQVAYETVQVSGCVADASGARLAGARVTADGIDYSGGSSAVTDASGSFVLTIRKSGQAALTGLLNGRLTNTVRTGPNATDITVSDCLATAQGGAGITMKLTWGASPRDLDSHLVAPDGSHVYFINKGSLTAAPFANLDVDDLSQFGPEVVTITRLMVGTYKYSVKNYSGYSQGSFAASGARVQLNLPGRAAELFVPPATGESASTDWWNLFELDVAADCTVVVRRLSAFSSIGLTAGPSLSPVYCTAR